MKKLLLLLSFFVTFAYAAEIVTPYPTTIELKQINGAEKERVRLAQGHKKYDKQPTGFYVEKGKAIEVNVVIDTPANGGTMPVLTVGTLGFNVDGRSTGIHTVLKSGVNRITNHQGGLIWLSFIEENSPAPKGKATITFTENSQQVRAPHYVYGITTDKEFMDMVAEYKTDDVLYTSDYIAVTATRRSALQYSTYSGNKGVLKEWMDAIHTLLEKEDEISGLDNNDPNPIHHRLKAGEVRFALTENTSSNPHASSAGYTGYPNGSRSRYLTKIGLPGNNSWMLGHELGHQHQQPAYQIDKATESTVNIYSYVVERNIVGPNYNRTSAQRWQQAQNTYLSLPIAKRVYNMDDDDLQDIVGFNRDELRFMMWEQMFIAFGDEFYQTLHRVTREEKILGGSADERRAYLIWKASQITGYDLTEFFNEWGVRIFTDKEVKSKLRARIANALNTGAIEPLPVPLNDFMKLTGQNRPSWAPLPLKGIKSSAPENEIIDRLNWTITTSIDGIADTSVGGDDPDYIIDGNHSTAFAFIKPGKSFNNVIGPADYIPSFTIDTKVPTTFNFISYRHRGGNTSTYIRARQFSVLGSDDGENFSSILENYKVDYTTNADELSIYLPEDVTYRYIKLVYEDWDKANGSSIQIAEFGLGHVVVEDLPTPDPYQFKVTVEADKGIVTEQAGEHLINEDTAFTLIFSLENDDVTDLQLFVDGDLKKPRKVGSNYSFAFNVANHTEIKIKAKVGTGLITNQTPITIKTYPNPVQANQKFSIELDNNMLGANLEIFNLSGQKIAETIVTESQIDTTIGQAGVYMIQVKKNGESRVQKLIVH